jgi:hypothetical protein
VEVFVALMVAGSIARGAFRPRPSSALLSTERSSTMEQTSHTAIVRRLYEEAFNHAGTPAT